jgi:hypothetical protein
MTEIRDRSRHQECAERLVLLSPGLQGKTPMLTSRLAMYLCNLSTFFVFFSPSRLKVYARQAGPNVAPADVRGAARGRPRLPEDALCVGRFAKPATSADVLEDLADVLEGRKAAAAVEEALQATQEPEAPQVCPTVAQPRQVPATTWQWHDWGPTHGSRSKPRQAPRAESE